MIALITILSSVRPYPIQTELLANNSTELDNKVYRGTWSSPHGAFGLLTANSGKAYFAAEYVGSTNYTAYFILFDGPWEDDQAYTIVAPNSSFYDATHTLELGHKLLVFDYNKRAYLESKMHTEREGEGSLTFTLSHSLFDVSGYLLQGETEVDVEMDQLTEADVMNGKITYVTLFTVINFFTFYGFLRHLRQCVRSETYALQTSLWFLGMNACIDLFLALWHMNLALYYFNCFDYLMLASMWSFAVFILVQSRLGQIVWRAQNRAVVEAVKCN